LSTAKSVVLRIDIRRLHLTAALVVECTNTLIENTHIRGPFIQRIIDIPININFLSMELKLENKEREEVFTEIQTYLSDLNFDVVSSDFMRPWGGFFVIQESQAKKFTDHFFKGVEVDSLKISGKLSPKILVVEPGKRLSWQYHHRRAEIWRCISGSVKVVTSATDEEAESQKLNPGDEIRLVQGQRHRIVGLSTWGVLAEIWQHTDADNPSDESDIVRVQDDFGR